jgi:BON domain
MESLALDKYRLERAAGLVVGIPIGIVLGPLIFTPLGVPIVAATSFGCAAGAVVGYLLASLLVYKQKAAINHEIESAAFAVRMEAGLPDTIRIHVQDARIILDGSVANEAHRLEAERVMSTIPGALGVINRIRFDPQLAA